MSAACKVSICIPTFNRPELLTDCLDSCVAQTHGNLEILVGDDSHDDCTRTLIQTRYAHDARILYRKNEPSLGQARNVASLFERATGDKILLIHDDDYLVLDGVEAMLDLWRTHPHLDAAFGNQYTIDSAGRIDRAISDRFNADYRRTLETEGMQTLPGRTGLIQMFPNNGWIANADLVKRVGYRHDVGTCCDFVFGAELCIEAKHVYYLHRYVSFYRHGEVSISNSTRGTLHSAPIKAFEFVKGLQLSPLLEPARRTSLRRLAPIVVSLYARNHSPLVALRIAIAHLYAYRYGMSARFYYHLSLIARSLITRMTRRTA